MVPRFKPHKSTDSKNRALASSFLMLLQIIDKEDRTHADVSGKHGNLLGFTQNLTRIEEFEDSRP